MLKSLFCSSKRRLPDSKEFRGSPPMLDLDQSDKEEDGFLLVGETKKEQTAISADNKNIDSPPGYEDVIDRVPRGAESDSHGYHSYLPGYEDATAALSRSSLVSQPPHPPTLSALQESSIPSHQDDNDDDDDDDKVCSGLSSSVLNGVMFKLSPVLNCQMTSYSTCQIDMTRGMSRLSQYQYDFHLEQSVVKWTDT